MIGGVEANDGSWIIARERIRCPLVCGPEGRNPWRSIPVRDDDPTARVGAGLHKTP